MRTYPQLLYNPFEPVMREDPYPSYRRLRELDPVHRSPLGFAVISRYADVGAVLKDPRFGHNWGFELDRFGAEAGAGPLPALAERALLLVDPVRHRRFRALLGRCFTPRAVAGVRERLGSAAATLLAALPDRGPLDVAGSFARQLPVAMVAEAFGLPAEHHERYLAVAGSVSQFLGTALDLRAVADLTEPLLTCERSLLEVVAERRGARGDDLLSAVVAGDFEGAPATDEEVVAYLSVVLGTAYETTSNMIGNSLLALIQHPDQLELLRRQPGLLDGAVEELLRFDAPSQLLWRRALEDVEIHGVRIPRRTKVVLLLGAANRDPEQFPDPDRLDLRREHVRHAAFGFGPHHCLGVWLARLEAQVVLPQFLARYPRLGPILDGPEWDQEHLALHAVRRLIVDTGQA